MTKTASVTLGVCGGVAAYKAAELVRALQQRGMDVHVVMTRAAEEFVRPLTFASLTRHRVMTSLWSESAAEATDGAIEHIAVAQATDLLLVAPATAHTLAKFAHGLADDFLSTLYLATASPVMVAPAMNVTMWQHAATQANLAALRGRGVQVIEPGSGYLACGMVGDGRLAEVSEIADAVVQRLQPAVDMVGETVLITAGGTREPLDPVRFLGNRSSGKMGHALAEAAVARGAQVILVSAPSALAAPRGCEVVAVTTAGEMRDAVLARLDEATLVIKAAAVSDFTPRTVSPVKLKRTGGMTLELEPTEDIARLVVERRRPGTLVIAFAAETENVLENARAKLLKKGVDAVVANDISGLETGFDSDRNAAVMLTGDRVVEMPEMTKRALADTILDEVDLLRQSVMMRQ